MTLLVKHRVPCETQTNEADDGLRDRLADEGIRLQVQASGKRRAIKHGGKLCSRCLTKPPKPRQRYCEECHAAANREYRARVKERYAALSAKVAAYEGHAP